MVTHLFNAMSQLGNREPGLVGAALDADGVQAGADRRRGARGARGAAHRARRPAGAGLDLPRHRCDGGGGDGGG